MLSVYKYRLNEKEISSVGDPIRSTGGCSSVDRKTHPHTLCGMGDRTSLVMIAPLLLPQHLLVTVSFKIL